MRDGDFDANIRLFAYLSVMTYEEIFLPRFPSNSEAFASKLLENIGRKISSGTTWVKKLWHERDVGTVGTMLLG